MEEDRYKGGIVFKWINKNEIYAKYNGKGKIQNIQAHIDKLHTDYVATRSGVDMGFDIHGLFGHVLDTDDVEILELGTIKKHVQDISNKNVDIFKTVISLKNEDAIMHGFINKTKWKELLEEKMPDIAKSFKIPLNDLEWIAAFHAKKDKPHCHFIVWNKNQNLEVRRRPYINFTMVKTAIAKGVYKEELKAMYDIKDVSKVEVGNLSKEELENYKENIKQMYQNKDLLLNAVETEKTQNFVNKVMDNMKAREKIYIVNNSDPESFTEVIKVDDIRFQFKNCGKNAILYKDNTYFEAVTFLNRFSNLKVIKTEEELRKHIINTKEEFDNIEDELKEIMPSIFNTPIISSSIKQENIEQIINKIARLEQVSKSFKKGFIYQYQEPESKKLINEIAMLIINSNTDCKQEFNKYIDTCIKIDKILQKVNTNLEYERVKNKAKNEIIKRVENQILKAIKETKTEEYKRKCAEWKEKREYWNQKQGEYEARQELYDKQIQEINIRNLIQEAYKLIAQENISKNQHFKRATRTFGDKSKREIKEMLKKNRNEGFDWFNEM